MGTTGGVTHPFPHDRLQPQPPKSQEDVTIGITASSSGAMQAVGANP